MLNLAGRILEFYSCFALAKVREREGDEEKESCNLMKGVKVFAEKWGHKKMVGVCKMWVEYTNREKSVFPSFRLLAVYCIVYRYTIYSLCMFIYVLVCWSEYHVYSTSKDCENTRKYDEESYAVGGWRWQYRLMKGQAGWCIRRRWVTDTRSGIERSSRTSATERWSEKKIKTAERTSVKGKGMRNTEWKERQEGKKRREKAFNFWEKFLAMR